MLELLLRGRIWIKLKARRFKTSNYAVNASIDSEIYEDDQTPVMIVPGMVAQVDIIRGDRTILEYFWQPIAKIKDTAFRE